MFCMAFRFGLGFNVSGLVPDRLGFLPFPESVAKGSSERHVLTFSSESALSRSLAQDLSPKISDTL